MAQRVGGEAEVVARDLSFVGPRQRNGPESTNSDRQQGSDTRCRRLSYLRPQTWVSRSQIFSETTPGAPEPLIGGLGPVVLSDSWEDTRN